MNNGHELKLPKGGEVRVRRCWASPEDGLSETELVEVTIETFEPYWSLNCLLLGPQDAIKLGSQLLNEGIREMEPSEAFDHSVSIGERPREVTRA